MRPSEIEKTIYIPVENASTAVRSDEALFIYEFLQTNKIEKTLEIGFGYGRSACYIMAATGKSHIVMDPFQDHYERQAVANIEKCGFASQLTFLEDFSHHVLPKMVQENKKFDFIFIDGDHKFDGILIDFYYADMLLNPGGYILFHDTWMRSTQLVMQFVRKNRKDYKLINERYKNMQLFQKIGKDERSGMFFREFYTFKNIFRHALIQWIWNPKQTPLKRFVLKIKEWIRPTAER